MTLNKKILAAAIVGGLFGSTAFAQAVNLTPTSPAVTVPATFASEIVIPSAAPGTRTLLNVGNALDLQTNLRYNFSDGEVRYARVECSSNVRFSTGSAVVASTPADVNIGAINGLGTNAITFSLTAVGNGFTSTDTITVNGNRAISSTAPATCSYSLYDTPSQAAAGGEAGRITTVSGNYITFAPSYQLALRTASSGVADVEASPSFSRFVAVQGGTNADRTNLGRIIFDTRANVTNALTGTAAAQPRLQTGVAATLADLLDADSTHTIAGDFSAAANSNGTFTGAALNRVYFSATADCSAITVPANAITATSARFDTGALAVDAHLCYAPRVGVAIPVSTYAQTFNAVTADDTLYSTPNAGPLALGEITRNGTSLQAQFAQVPAGWISRIVLTNTGSLARPYTITAQTEAGTTAALGAAATGSIPAGGTIVLNTADIVTFTGNPRGTLNVTVAGPNTQIQGLYQIVNGATGSIANTALVRPGTN